MNLPTYKKTTLPSGLKIITVPMELANSVTVLILVGTGSKHETKDINGISHFLEHMFFKGTEKRPDTLSISEVLDSVGGEYNAYTSKEVTGFWAKVDKKHADIALDWITDIFLKSKFDAKEIEREKGVIIEEINMYLDTPVAYIGDLWEELLYGDQPAGWKVIGEKENILSFNRKKIVDYYQNLAEEIYNLKEKEIGAEIMRQIEKMIMLNILDNLWTNHLEDMEYLRDSVRLRAYGQRDPIVEYKNESQRLFKSFLLDFEARVAMTIFKVAVPQNIIGQNSKKTENLKFKIENSKSNRIGRNDPCPCGSGKKYKKCHGA